MLPQENAEEAAQLPEFQVFAASHLKQVCEHFLSSQKIEAAISQKTLPSQQYKFDLADVGLINYAQDVLLEIAAAGGHSILFKGLSWHR